MNSAPGVLLLESRTSFSFVQIDHPVSMARGSPLMYEKRPECPYINAVVHSGIHSL